MKLSKKIKLLTLILMSSTVFFIYNKTNYNNITYTVFGDGLSAGIDSYNRDIYSYGDYVKKYLDEKKKLKMYSEDFTSKDMSIEKLYNALLKNQKLPGNNKKTTIKDILRDTDILTMSIGLNDLLYKLNITEIKSEEELADIINEIKTSFNSLIKEIRKVYTREIYIIGYYDIDTNNKFYKQSIKQLNDIYKTNKDVIYISTYIISENKNVFLSNPSNYYPNYKGYQAISSKIIDKISKKLEK